MAVTHADGGGTPNPTQAVQTHLLLREVWLVELDLGVQELANLTAPNSSRHHCFQLEASYQNGVFLGRSIAETGQCALHIGGRLFLYPDEHGGLSSGSDGHYELDLPCELVRGSKDSLEDRRAEGDLKVILGLGLIKLASILEKRGANQWL